MSAPEPVVPFGKYKGQPVEALAADTDYCDWLMAQPWFRERFTKIHERLVHGPGHPEETPEHNALQARFLDPSFRIAVGTAAFGARLTAWTRRVLAKEYEGAAMRKKFAAVDLANWTKWMQEKPPGIEAEKKKTAYRKALEEAEEALAVLAGHETWRVDFSAPTVSFESEGADVQFLLSPDQADDEVDVDVRVECKPGVGDDYPAVLRQMKANHSNVLLIGDRGYSGTVPLEAVRDIFHASGIIVLLLAEIVLPPLQKAADVPGDRPCPAVTTSASCAPAS